MLGMAVLILALRLVSGKLIALKPADVVPGRSSFLKSFDRGYAPLFEGHSLIHRTVDLIAHHCAHGLGLVQRVDEVPI